MRRTRGRDVTLTELLRDDPAAVPAPRRGPAPTVIAFGVTLLAVTALVGWVIFLDRVLPDQFPTEWFR